MNRVESCKSLMAQALSEPVVIEFASSKEAKAWRWTCYHIRQAYAPSELDELKLKVSENKLTMERKNVTGEA